MLLGRSAPSRQVFAKKVDIAWWIVQHLAAGSAYSETPIASVGTGTYEIRIRDVAGAFRTMYVTKFADSVYVLHAFQKKTQKTAKADLDLARRRYKLIPGAKP